MDDQEWGEMKSDLKWIREAIEKMPNTYASKWTESALKAGIGFILFSFLGAVAGLVILKPALAVYIAFF